MMKNSTSSAILLPKLYRAIRGFALVLLLSGSVSAFAAEPISRITKGHDAAFASTITSFAPASGAPGTLVTVTGTGFTSASTLIIGGKPAIVTSYTATQIFGMVMPGAITGKVTVNTGSDVNSATNFTVTPTPFPAVQQGAKLIDTTTRRIGYGSMVLTQQGLSVVLSADGNTAVVTGSAGGFSYVGYLVYTRLNNKWSVSTSFDAGVEGQHNVALSADGNTVLIGSEFGVSWPAKLYRRTNNVWGAQETLKDSAGSTVALSADGKTAILGKQSRGGNYGGGGYTPRGITIMKLVGNTWEAQTVPDVPVDSARFQVYHQTEYDENGAIPYEPQYYYAYSNIPGNLVTISADGKTAASVSFGLFGRYSYRFSIGYTVIYTLTPTGWAVQTKLPQSSNIKLSADGNTFVSDGNVYVRTGNTWSLQQQLRENGGAASISADGNTVLFTDEHLLAYTRTGTTWTQRAVQPENPPAIVDESVAGRTAAISADGTTTFLGVPGDKAVVVNDVNGNPFSFAGSVTAYSVTPPTAIASVSPTTGPVGTLVKVTGTSLEGATLSIGGKDAIVVSNTGTVITGMVMPGAVTGVVSVTNGSTVTGGNFTVTATLYPNVPQSGALVDTTYTKPQTSLATDVKVNQGLSVAVSADGNTAVVGTGEAMSTISTGGVLFYKRTNGIWTKDGPLLGANHANVISVAISADGNTAISGSRLSYASAAVIYSRINGVWTVTGGTSGANVGISADGNTVIAGTEAYFGAAYMLKREGSTWLNTPIPGVDNSAGPGGTVPGNFRLFVPARVAISADSKTLVVVVPGTPQRTNYVPGITNIYTRASSSDTFTLERTMPEIRVAVALSADGNTMLVDNTAVYTRPGAGNAYTQTTTIPGEGLASMSADAKTIMYSQNGPVVFTLSGSTYAQQTIPGTKYAGSSVGISADGTTAFLGNSSDTSVVTHPPAPHGPAENTSPPLPLGAAYAFASDTPATIPTGYATALTFTNTTQTGTTLSWTNGNGAYRAVFIKMGTLGYPAPIDGTAYMANTAFKQGTQIGTTGWYCVYTGNGTLVNITGLTVTTTYHVAVVEYNGGAGGTQKYLTSKGGPANVTTLSPPIVTPTVYATSLKFTNTAQTTTTMSWTNGNGTSRAVFIKAGTLGFPAPADGVSYAANANLPVGAQIGTTGWYCVYNGSGSSVNITGLTANTNYHTAVVEYNGTTGTQKYLTSKGGPADVKTLAPPTGPATPPTGYATSLAFSNTAATTTTLSWVSSNGRARAVFLKLGTSGALNVVQGTTYTGNSSFGAGSAVGTNGWYCVYNGTGNSVNITGLTATSTYRAIVLEYNGTAGTEGYNLSRYNGANVTTTAAPILLLTTNQKRMLVEHDVLEDNNIGVNVHQALSPNGDGINDVFTIDGIGSYPENTLKVLNSNGEAIYSAIGYNNYSKAFDGHATNGTLQKAGTYFYTLEYKKGAELIRKTGYLVLKF